MVDLLTEIDLEYQSPIELTRPMAFSIKAWLNQTRSRQGQAQVGFGATHYDSDSDSKTYLP